MKTFSEPSKKIPVINETDVVIIGGGPAGLAAAIASARNGAKTILIEQFACLGGTATASLMACINGFRNQVEPDFTQIVRGIAEEIVLEMKKENGFGQTPYPQKKYPTVPGKMEYSYAIDTEKFKYVTLKLVHDAGVTILFHTYFCAPILKNNTICGVIVENKSGRQAIMAKIVIDASGDADVAARCGVPFWQTRKQEAKRLNDGMMFKVEFGKVRPKKNTFFCDFTTNAVLWGPDAGPINGIDADALSKAEIDTRLRVYDHLKGIQKKDRAFRTARVIETPALLGVRQTRFIKGEYTLTAEDAIVGRNFEDTIAISACPIICYYGPRRYLTHEGFGIPYRCLLPIKVENLLVAGRCISSRQEPYESWRAMIPVMAIGQAAGVAAALCAKNKHTPRKLDVRTLQKKLIAQNAVLTRPGW
jgi:hypothetical protein